MSDSGFFGTGLGGGGVGLQSIRRCASLGEQLGYAPLLDPMVLTKRPSRDTTANAGVGPRGITATGHWRGDSLSDLRIKTDALLKGLNFSCIETLQTRANGALRHSHAINR